MTWSLNWALDVYRIKWLTGMAKESDIRWDGTTPGANPLMTEPRTIMAGAQFAGGPCREADAELAFATEMKLYFKRGVGEPPVVKSYQDGVYTVVGLITTTHPGDHPGPDGIVWFT